MGAAPRARVAVRGAHDRVRLRPAAQLRPRPAHDAARAGHPDHRRAGREPGRVQHLARGAAARRLLAVRLRDEAQELPHLVDTPQKYARGSCEDNKAGRLRGTDPNRNYGGLWGGARRQHQLGGRHLPRRRAVLGAGGAEHPRAGASRQVTNLITNHTYSNLVLRPPGVADFGFPLEEPHLQGARGVARGPQRLLERPRLRALRHHRQHRGLVVLVHRRPRRSRSRSAATSSTRRSRPGWRPSTSGCRPRPAPAWAGTARRTTRCSRPPPTRRSTR